MQVLSTSLQALSGITGPELVRIPTNSTNTIILYNGLAHDRTTIVGVPLHSFPSASASTFSGGENAGKGGGGDLDVQVFDHAGAAVVAQLAPNDEFNQQLSPSTLPLYKNIIYFNTTVPALGFRSYTFKFSKFGSSSDTNGGSSSSSSRGGGSRGKSSSRTFRPIVIAGAPASITNGRLTVKFDTNTGLMASIATTTTAAAAASSSSSSGDSNTGLDGSGGGGVEVVAKQTFWEYVDGQGGPYCLIMTSEARPVAAPFNVSHIVGSVSHNSISPFSSSTYSGVPFFGLTRGQAGEWWCCATSPCYPIYADVRNLC